MIPWNRCKRKRAEIAARVAAKRPRKRAERVEMCRDESEKSEQEHAFSGFLSPPHKAWPSSRGVGNAQGAQRGRQGTRSTAKRLTRPAARGRYPPRRRNCAGGDEPREVTARGAKRESARCRRQAWQGSTGTLGEPNTASGRRPSARPSGTRRQT